MKQRAKNMTLPTWNSDVYGKVHFVVDQKAKTFSLMSEDGFEEKTGRKERGQFDAASADKLGRLVRHYEAQGYSTKSCWTPEKLKGRTDLNPVLRSTRYGAPTLHWLERLDDPAQSVSLSPEEIERILSENQPKPKVTLKKK